MKVFLTGATGHIGSVVAERLRAVAIVQCRQAVEERVLAPAARDVPSVVVPPAIVYGRAA